MELREAIRTRQSIRKYVPGAEIPDEHVHRMLEAAMMAPSACNSRPWKFVVVRSPEVKDKLAEVHPFCKHLREATLAIVVCGLPEAQRRVAQGFWPQDCAAATENILLEARDLGYGTCWCGIYPREDRSEAVRALLQTDGTPFCLITVGVPDETPPVRGFYDAEKVEYR